VRILEVVLGSAVVVGTWISVMANLVVPRGLRSRYTRLIRDAVRWPFQAVADRRDTFEGKDLILAWAAPLSILVTLLSWLGLSVVGFGFVLAGVYLPAMYSAYSQREAEVTLLQSRAGVPAWGPEILMRHIQIPGLVTQLGALYQGWERWACQVAESHTSYPVLIHFRSPRANRNWLVALLAVLDAAALEVSLNPSRPKATMRMTLRAGFSCLREIADVEGIAYNPDPDPDGEIQLTYTEFAQGLDMLRYYGYPMERSPEEAWMHFRGWRVNYESLAYELAYRIDAVRAPWSGPRRTERQVLSVRSPVDRQPSKQAAGR
jgi:hypothetical protein